MYPNVDGNEVILSIGILVVNDDQPCQNIVAELLRCCNYQVLHTGTVYDALHAIWENKDRLDLVITNVRKLKSEGLAIIQNIEQKLNLNVLAIGNSQNIEPGGKLFSFSAYALNGLSIISFSLLLEKAKLMVKHRMAAENVERASVSNAPVEANKASSSSNDAEEASRDSCPKGKKQRVAWTVEMHRKFVDAVDRLGGYETAFPKKIVEVMGIPWLTREQVASHLQKYRGNMKSQVQGLGVLTSPTASSLAAFRANLPAFPQSSISSIKESKLKYMSTSRKHSYGSISRCKFYPTTGASRLNSDRSSTASSKFVGYRFDGNKIDYGPIKKIKTDDEFSPTLSSSGVQQSSTSSMYPHREDLSLPKPEASGNDESRAALAVDDMLQQHCSPPSPLPQMLQDLDDEMFYQDGDSVVENACDQFDFLELDDTLYSP